MTHDSSNSIESLGSIRQPESLRKYYARNPVSETYVANRFKTPLGRLLHSKQVNLVNHLIDEYGRQRILELACGPARLTCDVRGGTYQLAIDGNHNMIAEGRKRLQQVGRQADWELQIADVFDLDLGERFDLVYSFRFIRHFVLEDRKRIYHRIEKHLKPGGLIIFDVVNRRLSGLIREKEGVDNYPIYDELYDDDQFRNEVRQQGWQVLKLIPVHPHYEWLRLLQIYIAPRSDRLSYRLMSWIETYSKADPLEWIAVCQCG